MRMRIQVVTGVWAAAIVALLGGCTTSGQPSKPGNPTALPSPLSSASGHRFVVETLTTSIRSVGGSGIHLTPPPATAHPTVSGSRAFTAYISRSFYPSWSKITGRVVLADYTSYVSGVSVSAPPGTHTPTVLVWVVFYNDVPDLSFPGGPPRPSDAPRPSYTFHHCQYAEFISATTNAWIGAEQGCPEFSGVPS
jgi:hypothetical protein